ncbi:hypothetical protein VR41_13335 [Streptomyces sp. NRRL B-1568]|nr:hypothetical protein VR41_13335 [Streptomyces sp. NRRL B-1568]
MVGTLEADFVAGTLNKHGEVAFKNWQGEPTVWNAVTGHRRVLEGVPGAIPADVADDGRVVGTTYDGRLVLWDEAGAPTVLGVPSGEDRVGWSSVRIGEDGTVLLSASHTYIPGGFPRTVAASYRWRPGTGFQQLARSDEGSGADGLNDEGLIVGHVGNTPVAWHPDGSKDTYAKSPELTGRSWASGVNNSEVLVGWQQSADYRITAPTKWNAPDDPETLPDLGFGGRAGTVNDRGWIVGEAWTSADRARTVPVVWDPHGEVHRLDEVLDLPSGLTLESAEQINDRRQLVVRARNAANAPVILVAQLT